MSHNIYIYIYIYGKHNLPGVFSQQFQQKRWSKTTDKWTPPTLVVYRMTNMTRSSDSAISNYTTWKGSMAIASLPWFTSLVCQIATFFWSGERSPSILSLRYFNILPLVWVDVFFLFPGGFFFRMFQVPYSFSLRCMFVAVAPKRLMSFDEFPKRGNNLTYPPTWGSSENFIDSKVPYKGEGIYMWSFQEG